MNNIKKVIDWYESLSPETVGQIDSIYSKDAYFKDPFNEFNGRDHIKQIFIHMFNSLDRPKFRIKNYFSDKENCFMAWDFEFFVKGREYKIHGSTHLVFDGRGKIEIHRDYWDVGEELLLKLPFVKRIYQAFRKRFEVGKSCKQLNM